MKMKKTLSILTAAAMLAAASVNAAALTWTQSGTTTVTEADGVYTVTQPAGSTDYVSANLYEILENVPEDLATADGTLTVSYDLYRPSDKKGSGDWFTDISTNTTVKGWTGGNAGTFGRISGYAPWGNNFKLVPGTGATNGTTYQFSNAKDDTWNAVTVTVDLKEKTVKATMDDDSSEAYDINFPTGIENALYLNVLPGNTAGSTDAVLQLKNITAAYATPDPNATPTPTPEPTPVPEPPVIPDDVTLHKYPATHEYVTNGNLCNGDTTATFLDGVDETVKAYFADPTNGNAVDSTLIANYKNYICGTGNGTHPSIKATLGAGTHKLYYLGYGNESAFTATMNGVSYTAGTGVEFIKNNKGTLKVYEIEITLTEAVTDAEIVFDTTATWLPDMYSIVIAETTATTPAEPTSINGTIEVKKTFSGDAYEGEATALTATFAIPADTTVTTFTVSAADDATKSASATATFTGEATVVYGIVVDSIVTADALVAVAE